MVLRLSRCKSFAAARERTVRLLARLRRRSAASMSERALNANERAFSVTPGSLVAGMHRVAECLARCARASELARVCHLLRSVARRATARAALHAAAQERDTDGGVFARCVGSPGPVAA